MASAAGQSITLNGSGTGRIFEGLGAVSAGGSSRLLIDYPEPYRGQILDYLFKPNYGASLQHLKVEIGGDVNSTAGSAPSHMHSATDENYTRGYQWWLMREAKRRNPHIILDALAWGAPGWIGNGQFYSQDNINYMINFIQGAQDTHGLTIDYVGIWNETYYNTAWIKHLKSALQANGLATKVVAADHCCGRQWNIVGHMHSDSALMSAVDVIGAHYVSARSPIQAQGTGKPLWSSEDGPWRGDWTGATSLAKIYNRNYIGGKITKTEIWSLVTSYYDILPIPGSGLMYANTPWSGHYTVQPAIWATAHTTQFAQPGWRYIDSGSGHLVRGGSYVTLKNGSDYSVIIETMHAKANQDVTLHITGGLSTGTVQVWKTDSTAQFVQQSNITPVNGALTLRLAPQAIYSITTTSGQAKGDAAPAPAAAFPFPYIDTFEGYTLHQQPKYFSDINGSFEISDCGGGRSGLCLRQAVNKAPIPWHFAGPAEPASVIGSPDWRDYQVSADVFLEGAGEVKLIGRLSKQHQHSGTVSGYQFYVGSTGNWSLRRNTGVLASGKTSFAPHTWHNIKMIFHGATIQVFIDGEEVKTINHSVYGAGMAGLGVRSWTNVQFDNFRIDPLSTMVPPTVVPQFHMTATATSQRFGFEAGKAVDGKRHTFWHTPFHASTYAPLVSLPQAITLNLGGTYNVSNLRYLPRQDGNLSGTIQNYKVYVSTDGTNFTPVATGSWTVDASKKSATFAPTSASYVRLEAVATHNGHVAASEIHVGY